MNKECFHFVVSLVKDEMAPKECTVREPIALEKRVAIALYCLASAAEFRVVGDVFGVSISSVHNCVMKFCDALTDHVDRFIFMPNEDEAKEIAERISTYEGFPQVIIFLGIPVIYFTIQYQLNFLFKVIGMIDGSHIPIKPPLDGYSDFVNRKGWPSMVLQAVVDDRKRIRNISCCNPGRVHDAFVFKTSELYKNCDLIPKCHRLINGQEVPFLILGDPAYPLKNWLMKSYPGGPLSLPLNKQNFNAYLTQSRITVEQTFAALKVRWRVCHKQMDYHYLNMPKVITSCCILHNICEKENFPLPEPINLQSITEMLSEASLDAEEDPQDAREAKAIRDAICKYLWENFPHKKQNF